MEELLDFRSLENDPLEVSFVVVVKEGRAIKHVKDAIFTPEGGARRGVPGVLVVLTDGRSQDDVNTVSKAMQVEGYIIFAIGFADADYGELVNIASQPMRQTRLLRGRPGRREEDRGAAHHTFVCEAATATCPSVLMSGNTMAVVKQQKKSNVAVWPPLPPASAVRRPHAERPLLGFNAAHKTSNGPRQQPLAALGQRGLLGK
ncbi:hypothetical protein CRUP_010794 [Coryphaenoides rupestris]|nr:hypothetical protein CRUP_010794 [Coryphaenoides rupestris]